MLPNRIRLSLLASTTLAGTIACERDQAPDFGFHVSQRVAAIAGRVEPLSTLEGVRLGMTARELKKVRPAVRVAGYEGYTEQIGDYRISYRIPGSWSEGQEVPLSNRLVAVTASRSFPVDSSAITLWNETNSTLQRHNGGSPKCVRFELSGTHGRAMQWNATGRVISAVFLIDTGTAVSAHSDSARFYVAVGNAPGFSTWLGPAKTCPEEGVYRVGPG